MDYIEDDSRHSLGNFLIEMLIYDSVETHKSNIRAQQAIINAAENDIKENKAAIKEIQDAGSTAYIEWREEAAAKKAKTG